MSKQSVKTELANQVSAITEQVATALEQKQALSIVGGNSKAFLGRATNHNGSTTLNIGNCTGIIDYEPSELVLTAAAGTPLSEIETELAANGQMLAFEPPRFDGQATLGGTLAAGASGPRRVSAGAARDFILGTNIINGKAEYLRFGGQVMKNVAGYDISRLMVGAMGTLGIITQASVKVLPKPQTETTIAQTVSQTEALRQIDSITTSGLPVSASCYNGEQLWLRISGSESVVKQALGKLSGDPVDSHAADEFWQQLRDQQLPLFDIQADQTPLWRISVPPGTPALDFEGEQLLEWHGALRWLRSSVTAQQLSNALTPLGGHAQLYKGGDRQTQVYATLDSGLLALHQQIKKTFDPDSIFNPGRFYEEF